MAQARMNKDVRKNCVDVEKVVMDYFTEPKKEDIKVKVEQEELKSLSRNYATYHQELIPINQVEQKPVYRNYGVY